MGAGAFGCAFHAPLTSSDKALLGKVMTRDSAKREFRAMQPFMRADPEQRYGVYALDLPQRVSMRTAPSAAGGWAELEKCDLTRSTSRAGRLMQSAAAAASPHAARELVRGVRSDLRARRMAAAHALLAGQPTKPAEAAAEAAFHAANRDLDETLLFELRAPFAAAGDMRSVLAGMPASPAPSEVDAQLRAFANLARGLECYHAAGLVHRDIKPTNTVWMNGVYKFIDFGQALPIQEASTDTWQALPYMFFPALTRIAMGAPAAGIAEEQARLGASHAWVPEWLTTPSGVAWSYGCAHRVCAGDPPLDPSKVPQFLRRVVLFCDVYQLALTLSALFFSLTRQRFALHKEAVVVLDGSGRALVPPSSSAQGIGQLVLDATCAKVDARVFSARLADLLAVSPAPEPAPERVPVPAPAPAPAPAPGSGSEWTPVRPTTHKRLKLHH
jgi:hypothetical protein